MAKAVILGVIFLALDRKTLATISIAISLRWATVWAASVSTVSLFSSLSLDLLSH